MFRACIRFSVRAGLGTVLASSPMAEENRADLVERRSLLYINCILEERKLRRLRQQARRAHAKVAKPWVGSGWDFKPAFQRFIIILADMTANHSKAAVDYLLCRRIRLNLGLKTGDQVQALLVELCNSISPERRASLSDEDAPHDRAALLKAHAVFLEWRVVQWAMKQHHLSGLAPSTMSLLKIHERMRARISDRVRPCLRGVLAPARAWASRLRKRWCGKYGRLASRVATSTAELNGKARMGPKIRLIWDHVFGYLWNLFLAFFGTPFWDD